MFDTILFPTDGDEGADRVFESVLDIAAASDATVHLLYVVDANVTSYADTSTGTVGVLVERGEGVVGEAADRARERGVETVEAVVQGEPCSTTTEYAADHAVEAIAMPTHGRGVLCRFLLGSIATKVVRTADVPVLTVRPEAAVKRVAAVTAANGATLHVVSVVERAAYGPDAHATLSLDTFEERASIAIRGERRGEGGPHVADSGANGPGSGRGVVTPCSRHRPRSRRPVPDPR